MTTPRAVRVLLAEDEANLGQIVETFLTGRGYSVHRVADGRAALGALAREAFDVAVLDVLMPEVDGLEVLRRSRERIDPPAVVIVTGNASVETAVAALALGAYDTLSKPYRMAQLDALVRRAAEARRLGRRAAVAEWRAPTDGTTAASPVALIADDPAMRRAADAARAAVLRGATLVIAGPPGTGRATLARAAHGWSSRAAGPLVELRATGDLARDTGALFGRWADAAADLNPASVAGGAELADGGTLLLRDGDALAPALRHELERAVALGRHGRAGDGREVASDLALVVTVGASPDDPAVWGSAADTVCVQLPPLAARGGDVIAIARQCIARRPAAVAACLGPDAEARLAAAPWPGGATELRLVVELAALRAAQRAGEGGTPVVESDDLDGLIPTSPLVSSGGARRFDGDGRPAVHRMATIERAAIVDALSAAGWHQGNASRMLGLSPRTLYRKIRAYGLERPGRGRGGHEGDEP